MQQDISPRGSQNIWYISHAAVTYAVMTFALWLVFIYVPTAQDEGIIQRIFYFHVSLAFAMFLAFFIVFVASIMYLWKNSPWWDNVALSSVEIGVLFCTLVLITGPIWGRPRWNVWWDWRNPILVLTLVLWLIYIAYLMLRANASDDPKRAHFAAVLGIIGFIDVPIIRWSIEKWSVAPHPGTIVIQKGSTTGLPPSMLLTFLVCLVAFLLLFFYLLRERMSLAQSRYDLEVLRHEIDDSLFDKMRERG